MPNNGRVTPEHIQQTLWEQFRRSSSRNFYDAVPLHVNSEGAITFQDPGKDKQKQLLSPFQQWEQTNNLTDLK
jgi:hypothetical protein